MVLIEVEENEGTLMPTLRKTPETDSATSKPPPPPPLTEATAATPNANDDDSDGFETASERGVSDTEDENSENHQPAKSDSCEDLRKDEESKQKSLLAQADDAKMEGNRLFGNAQFEEALLQYDVALQLAPPDTPSSAELRAICHSNRAICFFKLGKYEETVKECTEALELNPSYMKALVRRGEAREKLENFEEAINDMKKILELDPSNDQARKSIRRLEPLAAEKREKMKEEMIGKLKEMGNSVLGRFGMSVDNFKAVKDPNTGSYSVSFQR